MKTLAIIGSTGSIGISSLRVFEKNKKKFKLLYLAGNRNFNLLNKQLYKFKPENIFLFDEKSKNKIKQKEKIKSFKNFIKKFSKKKIDYTISGMSGYGALDINFELLKVSKNLLIANKETIICGGKIFLDYAAKKNCNILPIDSEHHCIYYFLKNFTFDNEIKKILLTASGGPFFNKKIKYNEKIKNVVNHPTWKMGNKISVDSSTFANKVLELFEAKILFNLKSDKLKIVVENSSTVHSIIILKNNLSFLIAHYPTMEIPISNCLNISNKHKIFENRTSLNFQKPNIKKFPLIKVGYDLVKSSHFNMILFTVINERLVNMFLNKKIFYGDIVSKLVKFFNAKNKFVFKKKKCIKTKSDIFETIKLANKIKL